MDMNLFRKDLDRIASGMPSIDTLLHICAITGRTPEEYGVYPDDAPKARHDEAPAQYEQMSLWDMPSAADPAEQPAKTQSIWDAVDACGAGDDDLWNEDEDVDWDAMPETGIGTAGIHVDAYTDGSYNSNTQMYGWGAVLLYNGLQKFYNGTGKADGDNGWNINGELFAAEYAIERAIEMRAESITIHHDYEGVGKWADGVWNTTHRYVWNYIDKIEEYREHISISFEWVKGHSGDKWNTKADELAKTGAGIKVRKRSGSRTEKKEPSPDGLTDICRNLLAAFKTIEDPTFDDFAALKAGGQDAFSGMTKEDLESALGDDVCRRIRSRVKGSDKDYAVALRWAMRGLSPDDAAYKANVDREISFNSYYARR